MQPLRAIDHLIDSVTMYRWLLYGLLGLLAAATGLSAVLNFGFAPWAILASIAIAVAVCDVVNRLLASITGAVSNLESSLLTALILVCILPPASTMHDALVVAIAALAAIGSKYLLAWRHQHIFNPAAMGALIIGLSGFGFATWWIANPDLLPFTLILGAIILRKLRRISAFVAFVVASLAVMLAVNLPQGNDAVTILGTAFTSWPLIFLGAVMLTEPATMPPARWEQLAYGGLVGIIFSSQTHFGIFTSTPEMALIIGNLFSFVVSPGQRLTLKLKAITQLSPHVYDLAFETNRRPDFEPGQYMEFTLPGVALDSRGNRRSFSIASSPTESELHIGIKTYTPSSAFKTKLLTLQPGSVITASRVSGHFTLPQDTTQKLVFVAGGIGITPFRSMIKHLSDSAQHRDIVLFYMVSDPTELSYHNLIEQAAGNGVRLVPVLGAQTIPPTWTGLTGFLSEELIKTHVPDFAERQFYLSGPNAMVARYRKLLRSLGVKPLHIRTDYFSGY